MTADLELVWENPRARLAARPDVVMERDRYALRDPAATPLSAMRDDVLLVRDALDDAGIDYLLIRGDDSRPVLAVDRARRDEVRAAFAVAFAAQPFYARVEGTAKPSEVLLADGRLPSPGKADVLRLYRRRVTDAGRLWRPVASAVFIEFWRFGETDLLAPRENAITRRVLPRVDAIETKVQRFGAEWPTLVGMFDEHASDVTFPIDMVFSWVDGTDVEFQRERARRMGSYVVGEGDDSEARFRQIDELKFALRSVYVYAPWIRNIFIVTDSPRPVWLAEHPRVRVVRSSEFFADPSHLPTYNSHAVEAQLHRIPGLSEYFLYSNDDMFIGRPIYPDLFYSPGGITKFVEATTRIGLGDSSAERSGYENAARVNRALLREKFGRVITRHLEHCATPMRTSVMRELEAEFPEAIARTAASPFRSATDVSVTNSLYHYYSLFTGRAVTQTSARMLYVETTLATAAGQMRHLLSDRRYDFFCLNDGSFPEISVEERIENILGFLNAYFPVPAPWEVVNEVEAHDRHEHDRHEHEQVSQLD
ncbi:MAG TPA: stealth family protein [Pseudolysinimonas sp.]|nr:stealth family protein [Pseudolysinimonas sp.]